MYLSRLVPFITQLNVHKRLTSVKPIKVLLTLWARRLRFFEPRYSVTFSKWATQHVSKSETRTISFHLWKIVCSVSILTIFYLPFLLRILLRLFINFQTIRSTQNERFHVKKMKNVLDDLSCDFHMEKPCNSDVWLNFIFAGWLARHIALSCKRFAQWIALAVRKYLFVTIIRMETFENNSHFLLFTVSRGTRWIVT